MWDEIAQEICSHDKKLVKRLKSSRKQMLNDEKKARNEALRLTSMDREVAEGNVYNDYEEFYNLNKVWPLKKLV